MSAVGKKIFRPRRLGHANLWVDDLAKSEAFYNTVCGLAVEFTEPGLKASFLGTGNTPHDLGMIEVTGGKARYGAMGCCNSLKASAFRRVSTIWLGKSRTRRNWSRPGSARPMPICRFT